MPSLLALATPIAMMLTVLGQGSELAGAAALSGASSHSGAADDREAPKESQKGIPLPARYPVDPTPTAIAPLDVFRGGQVLRQVRIEQRVIVRISPQRSRDRNQLLAQLPQRALNTRYEEREMDKCVAIGGISGVQTGSGSRLLLFLRDARIITLNLEKACRARDFYSGFYIEKNADGKLCIDRDKLQSRSGAKCEVQRMRQLVAVEN
ncbi:hypothetical protein [Erythrobacter rubeus]|uniref:Pilus assembly protein PilZ n=1 Tax=Erythrobacter rubeus TaxID=2760803 RepID=A0ABR8KQD2_9SPHN|nr:hypothetical protein [Erythrobacter rubeus]MBD2841520.1 hypothetical protein [Erythrobacter rubeus]